MKKLKITPTNLDVEAALDLDMALNEVSNDTKIIIDLTAVQNISITAIGVISAALRESKRIVLKGCNEIVYHKIDTLGLTQLIYIK